MIKINDIKFVKRKKDRLKMHKKIWFKIHWFLGITAGIILLVVGTTGAIMSFEKEILKAINQDSYVVKPPLDKSKLGAKELLEKFQTQMPEAKINGITFFSDKESSSIINVAGKGEGKEARKGKDYFINPYTAEILPNIKGKEFFSFVLRLHRWLALPNEVREVGKQTVAISTISLIVLIISAIVIYWGRIKNAFFKSFTFSFKHKGRAFLSTMHSSIGMWVIPFYLLASLTGLSWSYGWYNNMLYSIAGVEKPKREGGENKREQKPQMAENMQEVGEKNRNFEEKKEIKKIDFDEYEKAINMFETSVKRAYSKVTLRFPQKGNVYSFNYLDENPHHFIALNSLELDTNTAKILKHEIYAEKPLNQRLMKSILPLHTGEYFGIIGQSAMFIATSLMSLFTITGFMLYFNRKNKKKKESVQ